MLNIALVLNIFGILISICSFICLGLLYREYCEDGYFADEVSLLTAALCVDTFVFTINLCSLILTLTVYFS